MVPVRSLRNRKVTLHIGFPKCATTSVQHMMAENYDTHMAQGVCYPKAFRTPSGYRFHQPLATLAYKKTLDEFREAYQEVLDEAGDRHIFFSCETLTDVLVFGRQKKLVRFLNTIHGAENVQLLISIRNIYDFLDSLFAQELRATMFRVNPRALAQEGQLHPEGFLTAVEAKFGMPAYSVLGICERIRAKCPGNDVRIVSIEKEDLGGSYLDYLTEALEVEGTSKETGSQKNTRLTNAALLVFREARFHMEQRELRDRTSALNAYARGLKKSKFNLRNLHLQTSESYRDEVERFVVEEKAALLALMDTPGEAIFKRKPVGPVHDVRLSRWQQLMVRWILRRPKLSHITQTLARAR